MGYNLLINGIYWGYNPLILTIDPNFQRDIQIAHMRPGDSIRDLLIPNVGSVGFTTFEFGTRELTHHAQKGHENSQNCQVLNPLFVSGL